MISFFLILAFGICSLSILTSAIGYLFQSTKIHLLHTAGTTTWKELIQHTAFLDRLTIVLEMIDISTDVILSLYLIVIYYNKSNNLVILGYLCGFFVIIGFILLLIKVKLTTRLYNVFTEWKRQKNEILIANKDINNPSSDDIKQIHEILQNIQLHEFDVTMFDLFSVSIQNCPQICIILLLTTYNNNKFNIISLISFIISVTLIIWKLTKIIIIKCGCNDSSDIPSKFASLNSYRPSFINNYNIKHHIENQNEGQNQLNQQQNQLIITKNDDDDDNDDDFSAVHVLSTVISDHDDDKDNECTSLNMYFASEPDNELISIGQSTIDPNEIITPQNLKLDSRFTNKKKLTFRSRKSTAHV